MHAVLEKQIPKHICEEIIKVGKAKEFNDAKVYGDNGELILKEDQRVSRVSWIDDPWIVSIMQFHAVVANEKLGWNFILDPIPEIAQFTTYNGGGHYDFHRDWTPGSDGRPRKLSVILMLSQRGEDYEGGEFEIEGHGLVELNMGDMLVFPSGDLHRVNKVTDGFRTSLITWCRGPEWR